MSNLSFCIKCGFEYRDDSVSFCSSCGQPLPVKTEKLATTDERTAETRFIENSKVGLTRWWRWVVGILLILLLWQGVGSIPAIIVCEYLQQSNIKQFTCDDSYIISGDSDVLGFVMSNYTFIIGIIGVWITLKLIHRKTLTQVITGRNSFDYNRVFYALFIGLCIQAVLLVVNLLFLESELSFQSPNPWEYLLFFLFAIVLTPYQSAFEEVLFRGYILQVISLITKSKYMMVSVSAILFAVIHLGNPEPYEYGFTGYVTFLIIMGAFSAWITLLDGGIELAVGLHAINNLWIFLIANTEISAVSSPALFMVPMDTYGLMPEVPVLIIMNLIFIALFNRKYKWFEWNNWVNALK